MRYESGGKDIPIVEPGCPAARWDVCTDRTASTPNIPVDLTGRHSLSDSSDFYLLAHIQPDRVEATAIFYTGEWLGIVRSPDTPETEPEVQSKEIVVEARTHLDKGTRDGYYLLEIADHQDPNLQDVSGNKAAIADLRDRLAERVLGCHGPVDGLCPAINSGTLGGDISATIQQFYPTDSA